MICRQCQRPAARRGLCWRHYRAYLRIVERAYELNALSAELRAGILSFEAMFDKLLLACPAYANPKVFIGLHDLVTTGVQNG